jgi:hypothetical protein
MAMSSMSFVLRSGFLFVAFVSVGCGNRQEGAAPPERRSQALSGPIFTETWEGGADGWVDGSGSPPVLVADPDVPSNTVQQISRAASGGDYFSPPTNVTAGETYCASARVKWVGGGTPFLGIQRLDAGGSQIELNWLIGTSYADPLGPTTAVSASTTAWQTVSHTLTMPAGTTQIRLVDELWSGASKAGSNLAYLDDISIAIGACAPTVDGGTPPPVAYVQGWESGPGGWMDRASNAPTLVTDATSPSGPTVQEIARATSGGDYFSPPIDVTAGQTYCASALVKWVGGGAPFLGIQRLDGSGSQIELNWLVGASYTDPLGPVTEVSSSATGWQAVSRTFAMPAGTTQIQLVSELWSGASKAGSNLAYLDDIGIASGACPAPPVLSYVQGWESGAGGWMDRASNLPTLVTDATSPSGPTVQSIDRATSGGDYFSPQIDVTPGQAYCASVLVKWVGGGAPFLGIQRFDASGSQIELNWLIGPSYSDPLGPVTEVNSSATGWQTVSRTFTMPAGTVQIQLVDELWSGASKGGGDLAYLDDIGIARGACATPAIDGGTADAGGTSSSVVYAQDWESGTGGWMDKVGGLPTLVADGTSPFGSTVQSIDRATSAGDYSSPWFGVTGGQSYCVSAAVKWGGTGATPFIGLQPSSAAAPVWIVGGTGYADAFGPVQVVSPSNSDWQQFQYTVAMPAGATQARLWVELFSGESTAGANQAYFDGFAIANGACVASTPDAGISPDSSAPTADAPTGPDGS